MVLILMQLACWHFQLINYVLAFSQEPIDLNVFCYLSADFHVSGGDKSNVYILQQKKNIYGTKQAAANLYFILKEGLKSKDSCKAKLIHASLLDTTQS